MQRGNTAVGTVTEEKNTCFETFTIRMQLSYIHRMLFSVQGHYFKAFLFLQRNLRIEILYPTHIAALQSILTV
jgi:hypothetical protein